MKNADENELRTIASDPEEIHMYNVNDFQFLLDIVDDLSVNLCNSVKGPGKKNTSRSLKEESTLFMTEVYRQIIFPLQINTNEIKTEMNQL